jgi:hypothetical protein
MAAGTAFARGPHGAAQPTWLGHCICRAAIAKIERNLRHVANCEPFAVVMALTVSPLRLPQRGPS